MKRRYWLPLVLVIAGCKKDPPPPAPAAAAALAVDAGFDAAPVVAKPLTLKSAADLEAAFPVDGVLGTKRTVTQEKPGFAEAKYQQGAKDIAVVSINDTLNDPAAKGKFSNAAEKVDRLPLVTIGKTQSEILVNDRYEVSVTSPTLDSKGRKIWLAHVNLKLLF